MGNTWERCLSCVEKLILQSTKSECLKWWSISFLYQIFKQRHRLWVFWVEFQEFLLESFGLQLFLFLCSAHTHNLLLYFHLRRWIYYPYQSFSFEFSSISWGHIIKWNFSSPKGASVLFLERPPPLFIWFFLWLHIEYQEREK